MPRRELLDRLKDIILSLHHGGDEDEARRRFAELTEEVSSREIAELEQQLVAEGLPEEEIKRLCDVHARVLGERVADLLPPDLAEGHPLDDLRRENRDLQAAVAALRADLDQLEEAVEPGAPDSPGIPEAWAGVVEELERRLAAVAAVEGHYLKKEYEIFPVLERRGVVAPPKVMWAVHDDVRALIRQSFEALREGRRDQFVATARALAAKVEDMIYKEDRILFPLCRDTFTDADWAGVRLDGPNRAPGAGGGRASADPAPAAPGPVGSLTLETGQLTPEQVNLLLGHLPFDITLVDEHDEVRYYSEGDRIFPRSPGIIGRRVQNCHPPKSVHVVEEIVRSFRDGTKGVAEFWLELGGRFVHIRYFAVRDQAGRYRGTLEVVQDVSRIRRLEGERRLLDW